VRRVRGAGVAAALLLVAISTLAAGQSSAAPPPPAAAHSDSPTVQSVGQGSLFGCALVKGGTVECWGTIGDPLAVTPATTGPVAVPGITHATAIAVGEYHACALISGGTIKCWGDDEAGELGNGRVTDDEFTPVTVQGISTATAVAAGGFSTCALITNGTVECWGSDSNGQLGNGHSGGTSDVPVAVSGISDAASITVGEQFACARLTADGADCWGTDNVGQLGNGSTSAAQATPVAVAGLTGPIAQLSAGAGHACGLLPGGSVECWGLNNDDQVGEPSSSAQSVDAPNPVVIAAVTSIAAGGSHTCARISGGTVNCWGDDAQGALGNDSTVSSAGPVPVSGLTTAQSISTGDTDSCAVLVGGLVRCWGDNRYGQLGDGSVNQQQLVPTPLAATAYQVSAHVKHTTITLGTKATFTGTVSPRDPRATLSIETETSPDVWTTVAKAKLSKSSRYTVSFVPAGESLFRIAVAGTATHSEGLSTPVEINAEAHASDASVALNHGCAVITNRSVRCWGSDDNGKLGDGTDFHNSEVPLLVVGLSTAVSVVTGGLNSCALLSTATVKCWGADADGQLGNGSFNPSETAVAVKSLTKVKALASGYFHTCALLAAGTVKCWGDGTDGQLGNGKKKNSDVPVTVAGLSKVTAIAAGFNQSCALLSGGTVKCWGANDDGQLGDGSPADSLAPVTVHGLTHVTAIAAGFEDSCAVAGTVRCWGDNSSGQLAAATPATSNVPLVVSGTTTARSVSVGTGDVCTVLSAGTVRCWGAGTDGQLGNATFDSSPSPVTVSGLAHVVGLSAGDATNCATVRNGSVECWGAGTAGQLGNGAMSNEATPRKVFEIF
jgi:alpha-tubulin suppressor-like RCC1 family protein